LVIANFLYSVALSPDQVYWLELTPGQGFFAHFVTYVGLEWNRQDPELSGCVIKLSLLTIVISHFPDRIKKPGRHYPGFFPYIADRCYCIV
jgi:hypothetical protein